MTAFACVVSTDVIHNGAGGHQRMREVSSVHARRTAAAPRRLYAAHLTHSILNFLAVRVARDERQEIAQRHGEITPGAALCIAVECAAVISEPGLFDR